jgi:hypothetical protein
MNWIHRIEKRIFFWLDPKPFILFIPVNFVFELGMHCNVALRGEATDTTCMTVPAILLLIFSVPAR